MAKFKIIILCPLLLAFFISCKKSDPTPPEGPDKPDKRAHHEMVYDDVSKSVLMIGGSTPLNGGQSGVRLKCK